MTPLYQALAEQRVTEARDDVSFSPEETHDRLRDDLVVDAATTRAVLLRPPELADSADEGYWVPKSLLRVDEPEVWIASWFVLREGLDDLLE